MLDQFNIDDKVKVSFNLRGRKWEKDGVTRYTTEIVGDNMTMLGSRGQGSEGSSIPAPSEADAPTQAAASPATQKSSQPTADSTFGDDWKLA